MVSLFKMMVRVGQTVVFGDVWIDFKKIIYLLPIVGNDVLFREVNNGDTFQKYL